MMAAVGRGYFEKRRLEVEGERKEGLGERKEGLKERKFLSYLPKSTDFPEKNSNFCLSALSIESPNLSPSANTLIKISTFSVIPFILTQRKVT